METVFAHIPDQWNLLATAADCGPEAPEDVDAIGEVLTTTALSVGNGNGTT